MKNRKFFISILLSFVIVLSGCANVGNQTGTVGLPGVTYSVPTYNEDDDAATGIASWSTASAENYTLVSQNGGEVSWGSGWYVVEGNVTLQRIVCNGDVHLILKDDCLLKVTTNIKVDQQGALTIYSQGNGEDHDGHLTISTLCASVSSSSQNGENAQNSIPSPYKAAIEGNNITVNGGIIDTTVSGPYGEGAIGGSGSSDLVFNGGHVTAIANNAGCGIGGGASLKGVSTLKNVIINGGCVTAISKSGGAGIGAYNVSDVIVNGGTVYATGTGISRAIGGCRTSQMYEGDTVKGIYLNGGEIHATSDSGFPLGATTGGTGESMYLNAPYIEIQSSNMNTVVGDVHMPETSCICTIDANGNTVYWPFDMTNQEALKVQLSRNSHAIIKKVECEALQVINPETCIEIDSLTESGNRIVETSRNSPRHYLYLYSDWEVPSTLTLDCRLIVYAQGHTIRQTGTGSIFHVVNNGNLTIYGGSVVCDNGSEAITTEGTGKYGME